MPLKNIAIIAFFFFAAEAKAQNQTQIITRGDTLILPSGSKYWLGETVTLKSGSLPNGSFNYIYYPFALDIIKRRPIKPMYDGQTAVIRKFERDGDYKNTYAYNVIVLEFSNRRSYWCDVMGAIAANEIVDNNPGMAGPVDGKQARLAKLKQLFDSGQITKDEYETLKNKIMNDKSPAPTKKNDDGPAVF
jgi:hypothetical protein